jgi:hypothetical protein
MSDEESEQEVEHTLDEQIKSNTSTLSCSTPEPGDIHTIQLLQSETEQKTTHKVQNRSETQSHSSVRQSVVQRGPPVPYPHPIPPPDFHRSTRQRRAPVRDDDVHYFVNAYDKGSLPAPPNGKGNEERSEDDGKAEIDDETPEAARLSGPEMPSPEQAYRANIATDDESHTYNNTMKWSCRKL